MLKKNKQQQYDLRICLVKGEYVQSIALSMTSKDNGFDEIMAIVERTIEDNKETESLKRIIREYKEASEAIMKDR